MSDPLIERVRPGRRRHFFGRTRRAGNDGPGVAARPRALAERSSTSGNAARRSRGFSELRPRAKRVIYLFQSGAPSQMDLFDHKPGLDDCKATELPDSIRMGQRLTGMTSRQDRVSRSRQPVSLRPARPERRPRSASCCRTRPRVADELCFIKSMHTEAINHDPAVTFFQTGAQLAGRPSIGSGWPTAWGARTRTCRRSWS